MSMSAVVDIAGIAVTLVMCNGLSAAPGPVGQVLGLGCQTRSRHRHHLEGPPRRAAWSRRLCHAHTRLLRFRASGFALRTKRNIPRRRGAGQGIQAAEDVASAAQRLRSVGGE